MSNKGLSYPFGKVYNFVFEGDSETAGNGLTLQQTYPFMIAVANASENLNGARWVNLAASGNKITDMLLEAQTDAVDSQYDAGYTENWAILLAGTNDIGGVDSAQTIYENLAEWIGGRREVGFRTAILTLPPVTEAVKTGAVNALLRSEKAGANILVDIAGDVRLQNPNDGVNYQSDHIHFSAAGAAIVADRVRILLPR